jgi:hypothetical protein
MIPPHRVRAQLRPPLAPSIKRSSSLPSAAALLASFSGETSSSRGRAVWLFHRTIPIRRCPLQSLMLGTFMTALCWSIATFVAARGRLGCHISSVNNPDDLAKSSLIATASMSDPRNMAPGIFGFSVASRFGRQRCIFPPRALANKIFKGGGHVFDQRHGSGSCTVATSAMYDRRSLASGSAVRERGGDPGHRSCVAWTLPDRAAVRLCHDLQPGTDSHAFHDAARAPACPDRPKSATRRPSGMNSP